MILQDIALTFATVSTAYIVVKIVIRIVEMLTPLGFEKSTGPTHDHPNRDSEERA